MRPDPYEQMQQERARHRAALVRVWLGGKHGWVTVAATNEHVAERYEDTPAPPPVRHINEPDMEALQRDIEWIAHQNASYT